MIKQIITDIDFLSQRSDEINTRKEGDLFRATILDLKDTIGANKLTCLSAVQIGIPKRVFTIQYNTERKVYCNPIITNCKDFTLNRESTPVIPGKEYIVPRYGMIEATYQDPIGKIHTMQFVGASAFAFQQMVDSLEGIMPCDTGMEIDKDFDEATEEERVEVIKMFCETIDVRLKELKKEIAEDPELTQMNKALDYVESVQRGETKVEKIVVEMDKTTDEHNNN